MAITFLMFNFSESKKKDRIGTKTYPKDSKIGISFSFTPYLSAITLTNVTIRNSE